MYYFVDGPSHDVKNEKYVWLPGEVGGKFLADLKPPDYEYSTSYERWTPHSTVSGWCWDVDFLTQRIKVECFNYLQYLYSIPKSTDFVQYNTNLRVHTNRTLRVLYSNENGHENEIENGRGNGNGQENGPRNKQGKRREIK